MTRPTRRPRARGLVPHRQPGPLRRRGRSRRSPSSPARSPRALDAAPAIPVEIVLKPVLTDADGDPALMLEANADDACVGVIAWMHTFSPGEDVDRRASTRCASRCCTCTRRSTATLPWATIDMDFMNLNQAAHGDREFGFIADPAAASPRKTVVGHGSDPVVAGADRRLGAGRAGAAADCAALRLARFGDNMRDVAVTEGDKVEAELALRRLGQHLRRQRPGRRRRRGRRRRGRRAGRRVRATSTTSPPSCARAATAHDSLRYGARIEIGLRRFLDRRRLRRLHHQLRGPRRAAPAARAWPSSG